VTEKTFVTNEINQKILEKKLVSISTKMLSSTAIFKIDNNKKYLLSIKSSH